MLPYFRDFAILENYPNLSKVDFSKWDWNYLEMFFYSLDKTAGRWWITLYYILWVGLGFYLNLLCLSKLTKQAKPWFGGLWTSLYLVNFWTIERVLMGHINLLKGHIMVLPILYYGLHGRHWWVKSLLFLWLGMVSPHILGFLVLVYFVMRPKQFGRLFMLLIPFLIWQFGRIILDGAIFWQVSNLQDSVNRYNVLKAMSPVVFDGQELVLRVLVGAGSWNTLTFSEVNLGLNNFGLNFWYSNFWANYLLGFGILGVLASGLKSKKNWIWSSLGILGLIATFGQSLELLKGWNWFVASLPGMGLYRESGKFYWLVIFSLIIIGIQKKSLWVHILASLILVLNIGSGINILSQLNFVNYPEFDKRISNYCKTNPSLKKGIFLPDNIYIQTSFGNGIFGANHYSLSSDCLFVTPQNSQVSSKAGVGYLLESSNRQAWTRIIKDLNNNPESCQLTSWWLEFLDWAREYDFWAWDKSFYQDIDLLSTCLAIHGHYPEIKDGDMEFYLNFSRTGSAKL